MKTVNQATTYYQFNLIMHDLFEECVIIQSNKFDLFVKYLEDYITTGFYREGDKLTYLRSISELKILYNDCIRDYHSDSPLSAFQQYCENNADTLFNMDSLFMKNNIFHHAVNNFYVAIKDILVRRKGSESKKND
jgi:CTP:phosphocholine cytidylyltransferase-like protein